MAVVGYTTVYYVYILINREALNTCCGACFIHAPQQHIEEGHRRD